MKQSHCESELRRRLIKVVGLFFLGQATGISPVFAGSLETPAQRETLNAFLDVLIPRDELSGSASDLAVGTSLWEIAVEDSRFRRLLELGCRWLDMTATKSFSGLSAEQQYAVVNWMSASDYNQVPRRFYELARQMAMIAYYSHPAAWGGLPVQRPPQPLGYLPPWE